MINYDNNEIYIVFVHNLKIYIFTFLNKRPKRRFISSNRIFRIASMSSAENP